MRTDLAFDSDNAAPLALTFAGSMLWEEPGGGANDVFLWGPECCALAGPERISPPAEDSSEPWCFA